MASFRLKKMNKILVESGGKKSVSRAMKEAGFSNAYAKNPQKITKSKSWKMLMKQFLPDSMLAKKHNELLNSQRINHQYFNYKIKDKAIKKILEDKGFEFIGTKRFMTTAVVFYMSANTEAQDKALDKAYKLKGYYPREGPKSAIQININEDREKFS